MKQIFAASFAARGAQAESYLDTRSLILTGPNGTATTLTSVSGNRTRWTCSMDAASVACQNFDTGEMHYGAGTAANEPPPSAGQAVLGFVLDALATDNEPCDPWDCPYAYNWRGGWREHGGSWGWHGWR